MTFTSNGVKLNINLRPGIYVFTNCSEEDKAYLSSLLQFARSRRVTSCSASSKVFDNNKYDLLMIDGYDKYIKQIEKFAQQGIILVDCKTPPPFSAWMHCSISLRDKIVEVF